MKNVLDVHKVTMRFGGLVAVDEVDVSVEAGKIFAIIGPNGAGKTTLFNAITGVYEPTEGTVHFLGADPRRPFTPMVVAACLLIGLVTGLASMLVSVNIDKLWKATIKSNTISDQRFPGAIDGVTTTAGHTVALNPAGSTVRVRVEPLPESPLKPEVRIVGPFEGSPLRFSSEGAGQSVERVVMFTATGPLDIEVRGGGTSGPYAAVVQWNFSWRRAWMDFWRYLAGKPKVELRRGRWHVVSYDSGPSLASLKTEEAARDRLACFEAMMAFEGSERSLEQRGVSWAVLSSDGSKVLEEFGTRDEAVERLKKLAVIGERGRAVRRTAWIMLSVGFLFGASGAFVVWCRSRRTADVLARRGMCRTFQNIRLFRDMTVLENVLMGMDRSLRSTVGGMIFRTPAVRREEAKAVDKALELLDFVNLRTKAHRLAKNLPYGDQRRLEISRALATEPSLLLLDEPAAGMNPSETGGLMALIRRIRDRGMTVLLIEHHMKVVMGISDRIAVLDYGSKIAEGTPEEIRRNPRVIEAYLGKEEIG